MRENILEKIESLIPNESWKELKPLLEEAFKIDLTTFLANFIIKHVDRRIYETVFIEALKKEEEQDIERPRGKDETTFEKALTLFNALKTGDPKESFKIFLKMVEKSEFLDQIIPILKSDSDTKLEKIESLFIENEDVLKDD